MSHGEHPITSHRSERHRPGPAAMLGVLSVQHGARTGYGLEHRELNAHDPARRRRSAGKPDALVGPGAGPRAAPVPYGFEPRRGVSRAAGRRVAARRRGNDHIMAGAPLRLVVLTATGQ